MQRIGIIGVGLLGSAVARRLLEGGFVVSGYDTRPERLQALQPRGLTPAGSAAEASAGPLMVERKFDAQMKLDLFLKDFTLMLGEGLRVGASLPRTSLARELCSAASAASRGQEDLAAVITTYRQLAGMGDAS